MRTDLLKNVIRSSVLAEKEELNPTLEGTKDKPNKPGHTRILASDGSIHDVRTTRIALVER